MNKKNKLKVSLLLIATLSFLVFSACTSTNDPVNNTVKTTGTLTASVTTTTYNGNYAPRHVLAIWIESSTGTFVKSLKVYGSARRQYLTNWNSNSSSNTTDAVTGATLNSHQKHSLSWNGTDKSGNVVGDGTYKLCVEYTENDGTGKMATFSFTKGTATDAQTPGNSSGVTGVSLNWSPN